MAMVVVQCTAGMVVGDNERQRCQSRTPGSLFLLCLEWYNICTDRGFPLKLCGYKQETSFIYYLLVLLLHSF